MLVRRILVALTSARSEPLTRMMFPFANFIVSESAM